MVKRGWPPTDQELSDLESLDDHPSLTCWEIDFLTELKDRDRWTDKQVDKFHEIRDRILES